MAEKKTVKECCGGSNWNQNASAGGGAVYGFGLIGALVYYIGNASTFVEGLVGILKSIVWPAMLVYQFLKQFGL